MLNYKRFPLTSFAIGESLRMIQSNDDIYYCENTNNHESNTSGLLFSNEDDEKILFRYLMYSNEHNKSKSFTKLNLYFSDEYKEDVKNNLYNENSKTYYDVDKLKFNKSSKKIFQVNNKCYFLSKNSYMPYDNNFENYKQYSIYQSNLTNFETNLIKTNISGYSIEYYDNAQYVDNKSIPIYDLNRNAIEELAIVKFTLQSDIINLINEFELNSISGKCLINSETGLIDTNNYDSILVYEIYNEFENRYSSDTLNNMCTKLFNKIFTCIPKDSLYRFLNPIGQISLTNKNIIANKNADYLYSINLSDNFNDYKDVNYLSLKNLANPELNYDYNIPDISKYHNCEIDSNILNYKEVSPVQYNINNEIKSNIIKSYQEIFVNQLFDYINLNNMGKTSAEFIESNNIISAMISELKDYYVNVDNLTIDKIFNERDPEYNNFYCFAFKLYMLNQKNINIESNLYIITKNDVYKKACEYKDEYLIELSYLKNKIKDKDLDPDLIKLEKFFDRTFNKTTYFTNIFEYLNDEDSKNFILTEHDVNIILEKININDVRRNLSISLINYKSLITDLSTEYMNKSLIENISYYNSQYSDLYKHNNSFKLSGYLYGLREYSNYGLTNNNDIWLSYKYNLVFDKEYLKELNIKYSIIDKNELINDINNYINLIKDEYQNIKIFDLNVDENLNNLSNFSYFKLNDFLGLSNNLLNSYDKIIFKDYDKFIIFNNNLNKVENYFKTIKYLSEIDFGEVIKGQHYYKETAHSKSNIFSIDVKNSGFTYKTYTYEEVVRYLIKNDKLSLINDNFNNILNNDIIVDAIQKSDFYAIFYKNNYDLEIKNFYKKNDDESSFDDIYKSIKILVNLLFFKFENNYKSIFDKIVKNISIIYRMKDDFNKYINNDDNINLLSNLEEQLKTLYPECYNNINEIFINIINKIKENSDNDIDTIEKIIINKIYNLDKIFNDLVDINELIQKQGELIKTKYKMQKYFENAIRKSIHRYIPANTALWKVQFSGN